MRTEIITQVAQIIRQQYTKDPKDIKSASKALSHKDEVALSSQAEIYAKMEASQSESEKEQYLKVERLKSLIQEDKYHMDEHMIEDIAGKIAKMLL